jgi:hypothetical protein
VGGSTWWSDARSWKLMRPKWAPKTLANGAPALPSRVQQAKSRFQSNSTGLYYRVTLQKIIPFI